MSTVTVGTYWRNKLMGGRGVVLAIDGRGVWFLYDADSFPDGARPWPVADFYDRFDRIYSATCRVCGHTCED